MWVALTGDRSSSIVSMKKPLSINSSGEIISYYLPICFVRLRVIIVRNARAARACNKIHKSPIANPFVQADQQTKSNKKNWNENVPAINYNALNPQMKSPSP